MNQRRFMGNAEALRCAVMSAPIAAASDGEIQVYGLFESPSVENVYLPRSHLHALNLASQLVTGYRGSGKTFLSDMLANDVTRNMLSESVPLIGDVVVMTAPEPRDALFLSLIDSGAEPFDVWRAVILRLVADRLAVGIPREDWGATVRWLKSRPEEAAALMESRRDWRAVVVFDYHERVYNGLSDAVVQGLMRAVLWLRGFRGMSAKVFLPGTAITHAAMSFTDSSKLLATAAKLKWSQNDLHGMLQQRLINAPDPYGALMRELCQCEFKHGAWRLTEDASNTENLSAVFGILAGEMMGRGRRCGTPYTWIVNRLSDGRGRVSPWSFLVTVYNAAVYTAKYWQDHEFALHYEGLKRGVIVAAGVRVDELARDYPWVPRVLACLGGISVPCDFSVVESLWRKAFPQGAESAGFTRLPAQQDAGEWLGVCEALDRLGVLRIREDGRIDMPMLYRVWPGFGRGGRVRGRSPARG